MWSHDVLLRSQLAQWRCVASVVGLGVGASLSMWVLCAARPCLVLCIKPHPFANEVKGHLIIATFAPQGLPMCKVGWADLSLPYLISFMASFVWSDAMCVVNRTCVIE